MTNQLMNRFNMPVFSGNVQLKSTPTNNTMLNQPLLQMRNHDSVQFSQATQKAPKLTKSGVESDFIMGAAKNDLPKLLGYIRGGKVNINAKDMLNNNALIVAAKEGHIEALNLLLLTDIDLDHQNQFKISALGYAAMEGHINVVRALILAGADYSLRNEWCADAIKVIKRHGNIEIANLIEGLQAGDESAFRELHTGGLGLNPEEEDTYWSAFNQTV